VRDRFLTLPEVIFVAATRGMLGAGVALLLSGHRTADQRRLAGALLAGIGAVTTIPSAMASLRRSSPREPAPIPHAAVGATVERY
jgi:hypothetical protein